MVAEVFDRQASYDWTAFLVATEGDIEDERSWSRTRPAVKSMRDDMENDLFKDALDTGLGSITKAERWRYSRYATLYPGEACDVNQDPDARPYTTYDGKLMTLISNIGLVMLPQHLFEEFGNRWITNKELFTAMGFAITRAHVEAADGTTNQFSEGVAKPSSRTHRSQSEEVGNTMHVNVIGALHLAVFLKFPTLGKGKGAAVRQSRKRGSEDAFTRISETSSDNAASEWQKET